MKAAVVPSVNGKWEVKEWQTPKAGPNQVVIKIQASGLCYTDVHITHGMIPTQFPRVLGHEPVGQIVEIGPGVTARKVGDRVGVWVGAKRLRALRVLPARQKRIVPERDLDRHRAGGEPRRVHARLRRCHYADS